LLQQDLSVQGSLEEVAEGSQGLLVGQPPYTQRRATTRGPLRLKVTTTDKARIARQLDRLRPAGT